MRTSLNSIREIERYIEGSMKQTEALQFEARIKGDIKLRMNVRLQEKVLAIVRKYHRKKLKIQLNEIHHRLFHDPSKVSFRESMLKLFQD